MVTWGKPESSLRVEMEFTQNGAEFKGYRQKSGAELTGPGVTASGQSEMTKFIEGLWGVPMSTASKMMLATQGELRGALAAGPGPSIELIEKLADFSLLDGIIDKIQAQLPNGNVKPLVEMLQKESEREAPVPADLSEPRRLLEEAMGKGRAIAAGVAELQEQIKKAQGAATVAQAALAQMDVAEKALATAKASQTAAVAALRAHAPLLGKPFDVPLLRTKMEEQMDYARTQQSYKAFLKLPVVEDQWAGTEESLLAAIKQLKEKRLFGAGQLGTMGKDIARWEASLIKAGECSFCGKVLDDVPEVIAKNQELTDKINGFKTMEEALQELLSEQAAELAIYNTVLGNHNTTVATISAIPDLCLQVDRSKIPFACAWVGPDVTGPADTTDYATQLKLAAAQEKAQAQWAAALTKLELAADSAVATLEAAEQALLVATVDRAEKAAVIGQVAVIQDQIDNLQRTVQRHSDNAAMARATIAEAETVFRMESESYAKALIKRAELSETISKMTLNNAVIKKLREARPEVARRLWGMVLHAVSHYASRIRDTPSTVTRGDNGFLVDGRPAESYSGSAKDSLGLAIRLALIQTFLPDMQFMLLDEPNSACDNAREICLLGTLATAGFEQTLLISHSDAADSFATGIHRL